MELQLIKHKIYEIRGCQVMLDFDLAELYEVSTKALNQAVKRNSERFPDDFMFQLTTLEWQNLKSQIVASNPNWSQIVTSSNRKFRGDTYRPFAFTEQGVAMLSGVLRSQKAIQVNIAIMRAFVAMRNYVLSFAEVEQQIAELEASFERELTDVHEVLKWLGEENQARANEISAMQEAGSADENWDKRERIGFKKAPGA